MHAIRYNSSEVNVKYCKPLKNYCSSSEQIAKWPGNADPCSITLKNQILHSKKCWVVLTQFWVKYGQTQNAGLKM